MRLAIVVSHYGAGVIGGAQGLARGLAEQLAQRGHAVDVWTSRAKTHAAWQDDFPAGVETIGGVTVRRFDTTHGDANTRRALNAHFLHDHKPSFERQQRWIEAGNHSLALYEHVLRHAHTVDAIITLPYLSTVAHTASWLAPDKTIVWPCYHNELPAYFEPFSLLAEAAFGVVFNAVEEASLALDTLKLRPQRHATVGVGVWLPEHAPPPQKGEHLLYVGRLDRGKNVSLLYDYAMRYWDERDSQLPLVVVGRGRFEPPQHAAFDFRGYVSDEEKADLLARAVAVCQPSLNESFGLTIMEGWLQTKPALVHADCPVTAGHVSRSDGGQTFRTFGQFADALTGWRSDQPHAQQQGQNGQQYVLDHFQWPTVAERFEAVLTDWQVGDGA